MQTNTLKLNKRTNSGYIFFDDPDLVSEFKEFIEGRSVKYSNIIFIKEGKIYYGIRMLYIHKHMLNICCRFKEVLK